MVRLALLASLLVQPPPPQEFTEVDLDIAEYQLYDLGVADIDGDGDLDIWTANHTAEQSFLLNDGKGGFAPAPRALVPEMQTEFPGITDGAEPPPPREGLSIWVQHRAIHFRVDGDAGNVLLVTRRSQTDWRVDRILVEPGADSHRLDPAEDPQGISLRPQLLALPIRIALDPGLFDLEQVYVGRDDSHPLEHEFTLALKDRHGHAWADVNGDGLTDLFIARGGLRGEIEDHPEIRDELLLRTPDGWRDGTVEAGLEKDGCRGRQAEWIDFDGDGLLDLWITGEDSPNLLYRQIQAKPGHPGALDEIARSVPRFEDVARRYGLRDIGNGITLWTDVDNDGDRDLFLAGETHLTLYTNDRAEDKFRVQRISGEPNVGRRGTARFGFGRPCAGDFDRDGDLDIFISWPLWCTLLINQGGDFEVRSYRDLQEIGLPDSCFDAAWVDVDGDGDLDLHTVPDGLFIQMADGRFFANGVLQVERDDSMTEARTIWFDMDGDGDMDALIATIGRDPEHGHHVGRVRLFRSELTTEVTENTEGE